MDFVDEDVVEDIVDGDGDGGVDFDVGDWF